MGVLKKSSCFSFAKMHGKVPCDTWESCLEHTFMQVGTHINWNCLVLKQVHKGSKECKKFLYNDIWIVQRNYFYKDLWFGEDKGCGNLLLLNGNISLKMTQTFRMLQRRQGYGAHMNIMEDSMVEK